MKARSEPRGRSNKLAAAVAAGIAPANNGSTVVNGGGSDLHELLHALQAMRVGDFSVRMSGDHVGLDGKIADTFNEIVAANQRMARAARARRRRWSAARARRGSA